MLLLFPDITTLVMTVLGNLRQEDYHKLMAELNSEFKSSLVYIGRPCFKIMTTKN